MNNLLRFASLWLVLSVILPVYAVDLSHTETTDTSQRAASADENRLSLSELARSRIWGLSETEWRRYQQLMQGIRGSVSPSTISPIEVLGIHARDNEERRRYAEQWARLMREDVDRILAFQRAYDEAGRRLYPNQPLIDPAQLPLRTEKKSNLNANERVLFFTRPDCLSCDVLLRRLVERIDDIGGIDIYLAGIDPGDDQAVRDWAAAHAIRPEWVRTHRVTLNHEGGALERLGHGGAGLPYLMRRQGDDVSVLRASEL